MATARPAGRARAASHQRAYFAPALFNLVPVRTDLVAAMAVDTRWRLYYNEEWVASHSVEETAAVLIHEVSHLLREHDARHAAAVKHERLWNTAADCEINDDLLAEGLPLPDNPPTPERFGFSNGENAETYYRQLLKPVADAEAMKPTTQRLPVLTADPARMASRDRGSYPTMMGGRAAFQVSIRSKPN